MRDMSDWDFESMPIGKHKGKGFNMIPYDYLQWVRDNMSDIYLRTCADRFLRKLPPPEVEECILLTVDGATIDIEAPFELKDDIKELSERQWNAEKKRWTTPLHGFDELIDAFPQAHVSAGLKEAVVQRDATKVTLQGLNLDFESEGPYAFDDDLTLYPYQYATTKFLDATQGRALITSEQGTGKTIMALGWLKLHPEHRPILVICPATMKSTWHSEIEKWLGIDATLLSGREASLQDAPRDGAVIINYDVMDAWKEVLMSNKFNTIIVDESTYIKSSSALRSKAVVTLCHACKHRILMTGTPILSRPVELQNQLAAIDSATWGNFFAFAKRYCNAHQVQIDEEGTMRWDFSGASNLEELSERLRTTCMIRHTKAQVLPELPPKTRSVIDIDIDNRDLYDGLVRELDRWGGTPIEAFTELMMTAMQGKIKPCIRFIDDMLRNVDKLIVYCTHREMINALEDKFAKSGVVKIDGSVPTEKRGALVEQFQTDPGTKLFLGNVKAAGMGITLTAASHTIFTELPWTPAELEQAEDRCHRITQDSAVNIYVLNAPNTVDDHITDTVVRKKQIVNMVNNDMSMDDLHSILRS